MIKIEKKIVGWAVAKKEKEEERITVKEDKKMSTEKKRPVKLSGATYRLRSHVYEHSFYVTINQLHKSPFEIFINTRNENCAMWITSQALSWSAIFREMSDLTFLIKGMLKVVDPQGAHQSHERFHKSIVAEIGYIMECEIKGIALKKSERKTETPAQVEQTKEAQPEKEKPPVEVDIILGNECPKCGQHTFVKRDGCDKCLNDECEHSTCE